MNPNKINKIPNNTKLIDIVKSGKILSLDEVLIKIIDSRKINHLHKYKIQNLIKLVILALVSGYSGYRAFEVFASENSHLCGCPSKSTFQRVCVGINQDILKEILCDWIVSILVAFNYDFSNSIASLDGKCLNGHVKNPNGKLQSLNVYLQDIGILLSSSLFEGKKSSEVNVFREYINNEHIKTFTADALHLNTETLNSLRFNKKKFVIACKRKHLNQTMIKEGKLIRSELIIYKNSERMIEIRSINKRFKVVKNSQSYTYKKNLPLELLKRKNKNNAKPKKDTVTIKVKERISWENTGIKALITVKTVVKDQLNGDQTISRNYVSNISPRTKPQNFERIIRERWGVENGLHRSLDMVYKEDDRYTTNINSAIFFNTLSSFVISIFRLNNYSTTEKTIRMFCNRIDKSLELLGC